jgi:hypothetical protein
MTEKPKRQALIPVSTDTIMFYDRPIVAVTVEDGRVFVVLPWLCQGLDLDVTAQTRRIERSPVIHDDELQLVLVETEGGQQELLGLDLKMVAHFLSTIDPLRVSEEKRPRVVLFQRECATVLYEHFARKATQSRAVQIADPQLLEVIAQYENLKAIAQVFLDHLLSLTGQNNQVLDILANLSEKQEITGKAVASLTVRITPAQQEKIRSAVDKIVETTQLNHAKVFKAIHQRFYVAKYEDLPCEVFEQVMTFLRQMWRQLTSPEKPEQGNLF